MAGSPFATSGNVGDIAPIQLKGGFTPNTGIADAVVQIANVVVPVLKQNLEDDITDSVSNKVGSVSLALRVHRSPSLANSEFNEEALANPNVRLALDEFFDIQKAVKQGKLPSTFALERLEIIQNNAIRNAPAFESEIRGAMQDATGQDPTKALFSRALAEPVVKQTPQQKAQADLEFAAFKIGQTVEDVIGMNQVAATNAIKQSHYDLLAKQGTYTLNTAASEIVDRSATIVTDVMAEVLRLQTAGTPIGVEQENALIGMINAGFADAQQQLLVKTKGLNVSGTAISAELAPLAIQRDQAIAMIKDGTTAKILNQHSDVIVADAQLTFLNNPEYGRVHAVLKGEGTLRYMEFKARYAKNPEMLKIANIFDKKNAAVGQLDAILAQASLVGDGAELEGNTKKARTLAAIAGIANTPAGEEYQMKSLGDVKKYNTPEISWSVFNNQDILQATIQSPKLRQAFIATQTTTTAGLSSELLSLAGNPLIPIERLEVNVSGQLQLKPRAEEFVTNRESRLAEGELTTFVSRFNRANTISAKYSGAGVLPAAKYSGTVDYWNTVKKAAANVTPPKEAEVERTVIMGADGKLVFDSIADRSK